MKNKLNTNFVSIGKSVTYPPDIPVPKPGDLPDFPVPKPSDLPDYPVPKPSDLPDYPVPQPENPMPTQPGPQQPTPPYNPPQSIDWKEPAGAYFRKADKCGFRGAR